MKAVRIHEFGNIDNIVIEETTLPSPKDGEVLVKIHDAGVNPIDWKIRSGRMKEWMPLSFPLTLGQDFAGEIIQLGQNTPGFRDADRVFGITQGSYAQYATVPIADLAKIPLNITDEVAAALPTPGLSAYQMIIEIAQADEHKTILIHGAAGGIGTLAVQLAIWKNSRVIATASSDDKDYLKRLGVFQVIDYQSEKFEYLIRNVDVVIDLVGGSIMKRSIPVIRSEGLFITAVGPISDTDEMEAKRLNIRTHSFYMKHDSAQLSKLAELASLGIIRPRLSKVLPLANAKRAQQLNEQGHSHGRIILQIM